MRKIGFYGVCIFLQVLVLLVPDSYGWANVGGLALFSAVYCFSKWLEYCTNKEEEGVLKRLNDLERETREMNSAIQWKNQ